MEDSRGTINTVKNHRTHTSKKANRVLQERTDKIQAEGPLLGLKSRSGQLHYAFLRDRQRQGGGRPWPRTASHRQGCPNTGGRNSNVPPKVKENRSTPIYRKILGGPQQQFKLIKKKNGACPGPLTADPGGVRRGFETSKTGAARG